MARHGPYVRALCALGLFVLEYLALSLSFDARVLQERGGGMAVLGYLGDVGALLLVVAAATLALSGPQIRSAFEAHSPESIVPWGSLALHLATFGVFFAASAQVLDPAVEQVADVAVIGWLVLAALVGATWLPIALPWRALRSIAPQLSTALALGAFVGTMTWGWGQVSTRAWGLVAPTTIRLVVGLLSWMSPEVIHDEARAIVGTPEFLVVVSPVCSGLEGVGLISALLGSYVVVQRKTLRVGRALALIPVAIAASFLTNALRIALLVMVGTHVSPDIALGGFHSKAGWLFFCILALAFIAVLRSAPFFRRDADEAAERGAVLDSAAAPYLVPMLVVLATALLTGLWSDGFDRLYPLRILAGGAALWAYRKRYTVKLGQPSFAVGVGVAVFVVWLCLASGGDAETLRAGLARVSPAEALLWLTVRALGTVLLIPIVEELAFRGFVLRQLSGPDLRRVDTQQPHPVAWVVSSVAFGLLHADWIAGIVAGLFFAVAQQRRGRLGDAVVAHSTANLLLLGDAWLRGQLGWLA